MSHLDVRRLDAKSPTLLRRVRRWRARRKAHLSMPGSVVRSTDWWAAKSTASRLVVRNDAGAFPKKTGVGTYLKIAERKIWRCFSLASLARRNLWSALSIQFVELPPKQSERITARGPSALLPLFHRSLTTAHPERSLFLGVAVPFSKRSELIAEIVA